jgi:hypothetical protein
MGKPGTIRISEGRRPMNLRKVPRMALSLKIVLAALAVGVADVISVKAFGEWAIVIAGPLGMLLLAVWLRKAIAPGSPKRETAKNKGSRKT